MSISFVRCTLGVVCVYSNSQSNFDDVQDFSQMETRSHMAIVPDCSKSCASIVLIWCRARVSQNFHMANRPVSLGQETNTTWLMFLPSSPRDACQRSRDLTHADTDGKHHMDIVSSISIYVDAISRPCLKCSIY